MYRKYLLPLLMAILMLTGLSGCSSPSPTEPSGTEATVVTEPALLDLGGTVVERDSTTLDLTHGYDFDALLEAAPELTSVTSIELGQTDLTAEQMAALREAFPNTGFSYSVTLLGEPVSMDTAFLDLSNLTPDHTDDLLKVLPLLPELEEVNFINADGICAYTLADIPELDKIRSARPDLTLTVCFDLFGQTVSSTDSRIEYYLTEIGNEGVETVRAVLPYLKNCEYFLMDGCGIDNEVMAELRDDFPETKIVWRVWTSKPDYSSEKIIRWASFLTDTHRIRTVLVNDSTCDVLKYCTETRYVDFGHNLEISDFSFLSYMPHLEAAIIGLTKLSDLTPLVNCKELEYLEIYGSEVTDLSPLAACTGLKHLNISRLKVDDMSGLYGLDLERFRAVDTSIPKSQLEEYAALHPDCQMLLEGWAPHENGWRFDENGDMVPRYALLREQMEYDLDKSYGIP